ncbi:MAG: hypothetical protein EBE86_016180 [Hormoscilla sp. GUM202]|nr:hypothetical protein [Hormoscilla sp. GUM202]
METAHQLAQLRALEWGNQVCQWDGVTLKFRVPACLEDRFGEYVTTKLGGYDRKINRLPSIGAKSWHFYLKNGKWNAAIYANAALASIEAFI